MVLSPHVYPRSFADASGDGVGDLRGITGRLDHVARLGAAAVWLSPVYPSPGADAGYDITDHTGVDPLFGTLADLDALVARAHELGLRVLLDYVPNHTSDEHPWFVESRASRDGPRRGWYLWRDPAPDGGPPTNWRSVFGSPAWTLDEPTGQEDYHAYLPQQPDLDWRNADVRTAMLDVLRFWLDRGVDGFRIDALRELSKDPLFRDNPPDPRYEPGMPPYDALLPVHTADRDEVLDLVREFRRVVDGHGPDHVLVGELYLPPERLVPYYGRDGDGLHLPANLNLISTPWRAGAIADLVERYESLLPPGAWPNWVLGNHDRPRIASRVGPAQARVAAMLLLTLRGTPTIYYGDEIGMRDVPVPPDRARDSYGLRVPGQGRDPERTPMRWDGSAHAGFCPPGATPWLPVGTGPTVEDQERDPRSVLALHRRLLALRRAGDALAVGSYRTTSVDDGVLAYVREAPGERVVVALNLTGEPRPVRVAGTVLVSTHLDRPDGERVGPELVLRPDEGVALAG